MQSNIVRTAVGGIVTGLVLGCTPLTAQQQYERANRLIEAKEEYTAREASCIRKGGAMQMRMRPLEKPGYLDYKSATCIRR